MERDAVHVLQLRDAGVQAVGSEVLPVEPEVNRDYPLVRAVGSDLALALFRRYADGSAGCNANEVYCRAAGMDPMFFASGAVIGADGSETAWKGLWDKLRAFGFVEWSEARRAGLVPADWEPPPRYRATPPRRDAVLILSNLGQPPAVRAVAALRRAFPVLADRSIGDLREQMASGPVWALSGLSKDQCAEMAPQLREQGLTVDIADDPPRGVPVLRV